MSAKFIDQIDTSKACAARNSVPAEAIRPRIVRSSGRPAATSEPKASTRIAIVTGHESSSDFIIALLFASLKSDHIPGAPVRLTVTPLPERAASSPLRSSAACTITVGRAAAPARRTIVRPSAETWGFATEATRSSALRILVASATAGCSVPEPCTTTMRA